MITFHLRQLGDYTMKLMKRTTTYLIQAVTNKGGGMAPPPPPPPAPIPAAPTVDNSEEVAKQRKLEEERAKREKGYSSMDNTGGQGVDIAEENIKQPTLLGEGNKLEDK
jgi:hypothetical protein